MNQYATVQPFAIRRDDPASEPAASLIREHLAEMHLHTPPESIHALPVDALKAPGITFWTAWSGDDLLGCGALAELAKDHGEIKSMRTARRHQRRGVASGMLGFIVDEARRRGYSRLSLETGSMAHFAPARALYERHGFSYCGPFGAYRLDPNSVYMTRTL